MSEILNSLLQGYGAGSQIKKERDAQQKQSKLAELMQQAYSAPREQRREIIGQMAGVDPNSAFNAEKHFGGMDEQDLQEFSRQAAAWDALPDDQKPSAYPALANAARQRNIPAPMEYRPEYAPHIRKLAQAFGGNGGDQTPASIRELQYLQKDPELRKIDMERRQAGWQPKTLATADGYAVFDPRTNSAQPLNYGGVPQSAPGSLPVGPDGMPISIDPSVPPHVREQILSQAGDFAALPTGAHANMPPVDVSPTGARRVMPPQRAQPKPSALQERIEAAKRLGASEADIRGMVVGGPKSAPKPKDAIVPAVKLAQAQNVDRGIGRIESALQKLTAPGFNTGPVDALFQRYTKNGQELEAAVGAIQNSFLSLTRVPGVGSQSDLEARIAALQYPSLDKDPEVNRRTLQQLREFAEDLKKALQNAGPAAAEPDDDVDALIGKYL